MSRTTTATEGDLVRQLSPADHSALLAPRGSVPVLGTSVSLWRLPGRWHVWSAGPATGSWWLKALDDEAHALIVDLGPKPTRGAPVVIGVWKDCIAAKSKEIRAGGRR